MTVLNYNELKTEKIQFGEIKSMKNGGKIVNVNYDNSEFDLQIRSCVYHLMFLNTRKMIIILSITLCALWITVKIVNK